VAPFTIDTIVVPQAQMATPYSVTLAATGGTGPYSWSVAAGALPRGLSLSASGLIAGTPLQSGSFSFTVSAQDASSPTRTATRAYTLTVNRLRRS
jgi:hypothetical protein